MAYYGIHDLFCNVLVFHGFRYFGFVTKHPTEHRFACHTFMSEYSTEPVAKAIGYVSYIVIMIIRIILWAYDLLDMKSYSL